MRILHAVDDKSWCWRTTCENIARNLPQHEHKIVGITDFKNIMASDKIEFNADLIFIRGYSNMFMSEKQSAELKTPFISSLATGGKNIQMRLDGMMATAKHAKAIYVQNNAARVATEKANLVPVMIQNGVDIQLFHPRTEKRKTDRIVVGVAANTKGSRAGLKGSNIVAEACDELKFEYREVNAEAPLSHTSMASWYRQLDFYIQPSEAEGCSNSVMEAMATGLPCFICKGVGFHGEACHDGIDGYASESGEVVFVERCKNHIIRKLKILIENPYIRKRISRNARYFAKCNSWQHVAPRFDEMFQNAATGRYNDDFIESVSIENQGEDSQPVNPPTVEKSHHITPLKNCKINGHMYVKGNAAIVSHGVYEVMTERGIIND